MQPFHDLSPFAALDVQYTRSSGVAACVVAAGFSDAVALEERLSRVAEVAPYRPGAFYERELPCILSVLPLVRAPLRAVIVDGYVVLDDCGTPGLGAHLHARLGGSVAVIGVAKTKYRGANSAIPVTRGASRVPLYVTAVGVSPVSAAELVAKMHGAYRIPTLLARANRLARGRVAPISPA